MKCIESWAPCVSDMGSILNLSGCIAAHFSVVDQGIIAGNRKPCSVGHFWLGVLVAFPHHSIIGRQLGLFSCFGFLLCFSSQKLFRVGFDQMAQVTEMA